MRPCHCQMPSSKGVVAAPLLHRRPVARCTAFRGQPNKQQQRPAPCPCRSSAGDESSNSSDSKVAEKSSGKIATTLAGLDALLGVQEEKQDAEDHKASDVSLTSKLMMTQCNRAGNKEELVIAHVMCLLQEAKSSDKLTVDVSPDVVKSIAQADIGRRSASNGKGNDSKDVEKQLSDQMVSCCFKQVSS